MRHQKSVMTSREDVLAEWQSSLWALGKMEPHCAYARLQGPVPFHIRFVYFLLLL